MATRNQRFNKQQTDSAKYRLVSLGVELCASVVAGTLIGWYIDNRYQTKYGALIGATLGIIGGLYNVIKSYLLLVKDEQRNHNQSEKNSLEPVGNDDDHAQ